jgi:hypothetical protein
MYCNGLYSNVKALKIPHSFNPKCGGPPNVSVECHVTLSKREVKEAKTRPFKRYSTYLNIKQRRMPEGQGQGQGHRPRFDSMRSQSSIGQGWARPASPTVCHLLKSLVNELMVSSQQRQRVRKSIYRLHML